MSPNESLRSFESGASAIPWGDRICKETHEAKKGGSSSAARVGSINKSRGKKSGVDPAAVRGRGRTRLIGEVRRRFIETAVLEQGYRASEVAVFLGYHASNVSRVLQREANSD